MHPLHWIPIYIHRRSEFNVLAVNVISRAYHDDDDDDDDDDITGKMHCRHMATEKMQFNIEYGVNDLNFFAQKICNLEVTLK